MLTTCYLCGRTDDSDLLHWGQSADYGFYHLACKEQALADTLAQKPREWVSAPGTPEPKGAR